MATILFEYCCYLSYLFLILNQTSPRELIFTPITLSIILFSHFKEQPPTPNPSGMCPDYFQDILPNSPYCYMIKSDYQRGDGLTWGDAQSECNAYHAKLASVHSEEEMTAITQALQGTATKDIWIGLQATGIYEVLSSVFHY